ncbi:hypothetical protein MAC_08846 [Metarhizium acridum CQMa 102]|uniref:Uncharacterized protein n=1 Tax=Metarhizium acridum (strain CQMa 102) TaxID=655827 RepID=E9EG48_METAQ|nr:uncharacterized protein MAC_08846 [Metarhizium acridum CQMa 102]EFY85086.1 hypothetical protein MAC_08846 [Metarhizium acridum CQMa 102]
MPFISAPQSILYPPTRRPWDTREGSWPLRTSRGNPPARRRWDGSCMQRAAARGARLLRGVLNWVCPPPLMGIAIAEYKKMLALCSRSATGSVETPGFGSPSYQSGISKAQEYVEACDVMASEWKSALEGLCLCTDSSGDGGILMKRRNPARHERGTFAIDS